jgi:hypothetical protein
MCSSQEWRAATSRQRLVVSPSALPDVDVEDGALIVSRRATLVSLLESHDVRWNWEECARERTAVGTDRGVLPDKACDLWLR